MLKLSVIIPTCSRSNILGRCLQAILNQSVPSSTYEVLVVDDGSTDDTPQVVAQFMDREGVHYFHQPHRGPSAARNLGIRKARGELVLFIGDDILAPPNLLELHIARYAQFQDGATAVLGTSVWSPEIDLTPLMRYSQEGRAVPMFQFNRISDPDHVPYEFLITSNVSIPRQFMLDNGFFDEDFPYAYGEDTELGYRLVKNGLHIVLESSAQVYHYHLVTYRALCHRARIAGRVSVLQVQKHPEWGSLDFLKLSWRGKIRNGIRKAIACLVVDPFLRFADRRRWDLFFLPALYDWAIECHRFWGQLEGLEIFGVEL
jgi:glycosyltransferase involved in cell wall biosynthesis